MLLKTIFFFLTITTCQWAGRGGWRSWQAWGPWGSQKSLLTLSFQPQGGVSSPPPSLDSQVAACRAGSFLFPSSSLPPQMQHHSQTNAPSTKKEIENPSQTLVPAALPHTIQALGTIFCPWRDFQAFKCYSVHTQFSHGLAQGKLANV